MFYVGIDITKFKHDCFICSDSGEIICSNLTFRNTLQGFNQLLSILSSLASSDGIRIGFEFTGHYALNLKLFLEKAHYSFMEFNPALLNKFIHSQTLRKTKSDAIDCTSIARQRSFYLVKLTNVLNHIFPEFKPFFNHRLEKILFIY
jgi:transposase